MMNLHRYIESPTREGKTKIINSIADTLQYDVGARFLKKFGKERYMELDSRQIREKVGHALRDMVSQQRITRKNVGI